MKKKQPIFKITKSAVKQAWSIMMALLVGMLIAMVLMMGLQLYQLTRSIAVIESYLGEAFGVKPQDIREMSEKIQRLPWVTREEANLYAMHICLGANRQGVDDKLIFWLIYYESNFDWEARSEKNCQGLMQLNPKIFRYPRDELMEPGWNIALGTAHFAECKVRSQGDQALAVKLYHGNPYHWRSIWLSDKVMGKYSQEV